MSTAVVRKIEDAGKGGELIGRDFYPSLEKTFGRIDKAVYQQLWWKLEDCGMNLGYAKAQNDGLDERHDQEATEI